MRNVILFFLGLSALAMAVGCQPQAGSANLPTYPALTSTAALAILARRAAAIHAFTAQCQLTLDRGDHQTVQLDGLMVMAPPDRLRLRVWKLNQAVFDLTVLPDGLWVETPPEAQQQGPILPAALSAGQLARFLSWFEGGFFSDPNLEARPAGKSTLVFRRAQEDGTSILCQVDRATATARQFSLVDADGHVRFSLAMSDYRDISGNLWPTRLSAIALDSTKGDSRIDITFSDIEFNGELAPRAFVPPPNAEKRP